MKSSRNAALCLLALVVAAGCASTKVSDRQVLVTEIAEKIKPRFQQEGWIE